MSIKFEVRDFWMTKAGWWKTEQLKRKKQLRQKTWTRQGQSKKKQESRTCWTWHWNPWTKYYFRGIKTITTLPKIFYISFVIFIKWHLPNTLFRYLYPYKRGWWKVKEYQLCFFRCDKLISSPKDKSIPIHLQRVCWYRRTRRRNYWMEGLF